MHGSSATDHNSLKKKSIDCVVEGEAENVIGKIFKAAINGEALQPHYEVSAKDAPQLEDIPDIVQPSVNGLIELGRGCCRGCEFCNVTLRPLRWYPLRQNHSGISRQR